MICGLALFREQPCAVLQIRLRLGARERSRPIHDQPAPFMDAKINREPLPTQSRLWVLLPIMVGVLVPNVPVSFFTLDSIPGQRHAAHARTDGIDEFRELLLNRKLSDRSSLVPQTKSFVSSNSPLLKWPRNLRATSSGLSPFVSAGGRRRQSGRSNSSSTTISNAGSLAVSRLVASCCGSSANKSSSRASDPTPTSSSAITCRIMWCSRSACVVTLAGYRYPQTTA